MDGINAHQTEGNKMSFRKASVVAYSAVALAFGATQPAAAQGKFEREQHFNTHINLLFDDGKTETTVRCGYMLAKGKPKHYPSLTSVSMHDTEARTLTAISANAGRISLMKVEKFDHAGTALNAVVHVQDDKSWVAKSCTYNAVTLRVTACKPTDPSADALSVKQTFVFKATKVCNEHLDKPGFKLEVQADEMANANKARIEMMRQDREKLSAMGFQVEIPKGN
jgi:hypothetical protein